MKLTLSHPSAFFNPPFPLSPVLFPLFPPALYQSFSCFIPQCLLPNSSYLRPSSLPYLLLILSLSLTLPPSFPSSSLSLSLLILSVSLTHSPHHQQLQTEDVYFELLSYGSLMTLNCFICLTGLGPGASGAPVDPTCQHQTGTGAKR